MSEQVSNEQAAARDAILKIERMSERDQGFIEGYMARAIAEKEA